MMSQVDTLTEHHTTVHVPSTTTNEYYQQLNILNDVAWFSTGYKSLHLLLTDILIVTQLAVISYESIPQYCAGVTRMQLAKVVITSVFVIVGCGEGLPEGKGLWVY